MKKNVFFVAAIFAALCLNSCDKNDPDNPMQEVRERFS